jgi:hypothetical protein
VFVAIIPVKLSWDFTRPLGMLKNIETSNLQCVCEQCVTKYQSAEFKWDIYFVNKVETQLREKPLRGSQTQEFYYLEDKASNKHSYISMQRSYFAL